MPPTLSGLEFVLLVDVLTRVSLVLLFGLLLSRCFVKRDAALRHACLVAGLVAASLVPAAMFLVRALPSPLMPIALPASGDFAVRERPSPSLEPDSTQYEHRMIEDGARPETQGLFKSRPDAGWLRGARSLAHALILAIAVVAGMRVVGLLLSLLRVRRIALRAKPVEDDAVLALLDLVYEHVSLKRTPQLLESAEVSSPVAAGILGDVVLLPTGWAGRLGRVELTAILCHEIAHLARRDHRVVLLQELLASALWFHPLMHLFNRALDRVREEVCDNHAIGLVDRPEYCGALLAVATGRLGSPARGVTSLWPRHWSLETRVRGILDEERSTVTRISGLARSVAVILAAVCCGVVALPQLTSSQAVGRDVLMARSGEGDIETRRLVKSFPANDGRLLRIENLAGRVELVPGSGPNVEVEAFVRVSDLPKDEARLLIEGIRWVEASGERDESRWGLSFPTEKYSTIRYAVDGETKTAGFDAVQYLDREVRIARNRGESVPALEFDLRISIPPGARVAIDNVVGPLEGRSIAGSLRLSTRHGVIKLDDMRAPIDAKSKFGDILLSRLDADAVVHAESGDIELSRTTSGRVSLSTGTGLCRIVQPSESDFKLQYSGDRPIGLIGGTAARISSRQDGRVSVLLSRGKGGPSITLTSGSGDSVIELGP